MTAVALRRIAILPDIGCCQLFEHQIAAAAGDERHPAQRGRWIAGGSGKTSVLVVRHGEAAGEELAQVDAVDGAFVGGSIGGAHEEFARGNPYKIGKGRLSQNGQYITVRPAAGTR